MEVFDNINKTVKDDLIVTIKKDSRLSIAAACFSIYAYQVLKKQLDSVGELRFIFTSPAFVTEKAPKEKREFYIPQLNRERSLYGTEFEVKLRNELSQKVVARECADWIRKKVRFMSNITNENMNGFLNVATEKERFTYMPMNGFTTVDIGCERGNNAYNMITRLETPASDQFLALFDQVWNDTKRLRDVTNEVIDSITAAYKENPADFLYFFTLYNIFSEFLEDITEDNLPNEATGFKESCIWNKLYSFQKDAALAIISKLEQYNGCILADSVGLGKTFSALAVIKYYENRNRNVLVLCPKKLSDNWRTFRENYKNNPIAKDRLRYDVLFHTDLMREHGLSGGIDLDKINWENYDLVVIDESHNFRNGGEVYGEDRKENRYLRLLNRVIRRGVKTKVLMLSATPVNNRFTDLRNQLRLAYEGDQTLINKKLNVSKPIDEIFKNAQTVFNKWSKQDDRKSEELLKQLDFDFFEVLDSVTIARSRKHIQKYYDMTEIGAFPKRLPPISLRPCLTDLNRAINYGEIYGELSRLNLAVYAPMNYVHASKLSKYLDKATSEGDALRIKGQEVGIVRLMTINLLKRLESSVYSFRMTLDRIRELINGMIGKIDHYSGGASIVDVAELNNTDFDFDDQNTDFLSYGKNRRIDLADMDYLSWREQLAADAEILNLLALMVADITSEHDGKLQELLKLITQKITAPINGDNKKILIFSAFSDTAEYLYANVSAYVKDRFELDVAMITGSTDGKTTVKLQHTDMNTILTLFSPLSKDKDILMPESNAKIDILIGTDCISEGQNLQDCDYCVNYDIHWNPVRIIQRFGRIDRIGSRNAVIQLVNFWPDMELDEYINLKGRVETRMTIVVAAATGDENPIDPDAKGELEYRKAQLERLQHEVVDIEDMQSGISIMDLGLNEFRLDLLDYVKTHGDLDAMPFGLHTVVPSSADCPPGVIYVLKNINGGVNIGNQNQIHPFYMVYITNGGEVVCDHLSPKAMFDTLRLLCKGKTKPIDSLCREFNTETKDGKNMRRYSELLSNAIDSIIDAKGQSELDAFLSGEAVSFASGQIKGLDDFELICFLAVR
ncbi:helicase [Synergistales bacterium]|nr:helicase [Synergistales bacterium]